MQHKIISKDEKSNLLTLVFLGWSSDGNALSDTTTHGNVIALFDYNDLTTATDLSDWDGINVFAWSMGVMVAEHFMSANPHMPWKTKTALCGTPHPMGRPYGIDREMLELTLANWNERNREKFNMRMCGGRTNYAKCKHLMSQRSIESQQSELQRLMRMADVETPAKNAIMWDKAIIATNDLVFPHESQEAYWRRHANDIEQSPTMPHFPFSHDANIIW